MKANLKLIKRIINILIHVLLMSLVGWVADQFGDDSTLHNSFTVIDYLIIISGAIQCISIVQEPLQDLYNSYKIKRNDYKIISEKQKIELKDLKDESITITKLPEINKEVE